jgi:hypothetical protein
MPISYACQIAHWVQVMVAVLAVLSAVIWGLASNVNSPAELTYQSAPDLMRAVAKQSPLNARAARSAALAALCQMGAVLLPNCQG